MTISVVVPSYKSAKTLPRVIDSLLYKGAPVLEIIVVEDGIVDETQSVLEKYSAVKHIQKTSNGGAAVARNIGLEIAQGKYVIFIDADDYIKPGLLEGLIYKINLENTDLALAPCLSFWPGTGKKSLFTPTSIDAKENYHVAQRWLRGQSGPGTCSIMWRTSSIKKIGGWDESLKRNQDGELVIRASLLGLRFSVSLDSYSVYVRATGEGNISSDFSPTAFASLYTIGEKFNGMLHDESHPEIIRKALKSYWARSSLLAYAHKNSSYGKSFARMAGLTGYINMDVAPTYKALILLLGPRFASLIWYKLIKIKNFLYN